MKTGKKIWRKVWKLVTVCLVLLLALFCVLEGIVIAGSGSSKDQEADVVIILGAMVYQRGPSPVLVRRLNAALGLAGNPPGCGCGCQRRTGHG